MIKTSENIFIIFSEVLCFNFSLYKINYYFLYYFIFCFFIYLYKQSIIIFLITNLHKYFKFVNKVQTGVYPASILIRILFYRKV